MDLNILAIVQARMGSTRLPGKVLEKVNGIPLIEILLRRLSRSKKVDKIVLATSQAPENDQLVKVVEERGFEAFRGSENDVLSRYYEAAACYSPNTVVRITGDCPLIDPELVDEVVGFYESKNVDYVSNVSPPSYPDGLDTEVFSFFALKQAYDHAKESHEREHVTPFIYSSGRFKCLNYPNEADYSGERWTVDEPEDLEVVANILNHFGSNIAFSWRNVIELRDTNPEYFEANKTVKRNEGMDFGIGQKLYLRAKKVIPGGNMLLSKSPEMFLPGGWPAYFSRAKGCRVWDLDGNEYIDMSIMGIGTNILGYGHPEVDEAVRKTVELGNMSTFNCPEEVYLAEKLVELHPWAEMARFARSGGEANAIAIRIARAATGKDKVAICGYHGWHDWYLAANLGNATGLDGHLLPGLKPNGVPQNLKGSILPFSYNDFESLEQLMQQHDDIGVIKMEVSRSLGPEKGFLESVRKLATEKNIILIFDECTSGFRETFGGLHKKFGVDPDMAIFGKALGNGYAITAVIGKREVMEAAQNTFISSTFWTERIGPTAALKTLEVMERIKSWETITSTGLLIRNGLQKLAESHKLRINQWGLLALTGYTFGSENANAYKTLVTQEMLKKGFLASNSVYVCTEHTPAIVDSFLCALDPIFTLIKECEEGRDIYGLLNGPECHKGFARLN